MTLCIPLENNMQPRMVNNWHGTDLFHFVHTDGQKSFQLSREELERYLEGVTFAAGLKKMDVVSIICRSMPPMTRKIFADYGVPVLFTGPETVEKVIIKWQKGFLSDEPLQTNGDTSCTGSCGTCSSSTCR